MNAQLDEQELKANLTTMERNAGVNLPPDLSNRLNKLL